MFQDKERMDYLQQEVSEELKNRTWSSIQQRKKKQAKQRRQAVVIAACFAGVIFTGNLAIQSSTVVRVNDKPVSYLNVVVKEEENDSPFMISEGKNRKLQIEIPMEINVAGNAHVEVSEGIIYTDNANPVKDMKEMDIQGKTMIIWCIKGDSDTIATCIVKTETKEYQYVMEQNGISWKIRLEQGK